MRIGHAVILAALVAAVAFVAAAVGAERHDDAVGAWYHEHWDDSLDHAINDAKLGVQTEFTPGEPPAAPVLVRQPLVTASGAGLATFVLGLLVVIASALTAPPRSSDDPPRRGVDLAP